MEPDEMCDAIERLVEMTKGMRTDKGEPLKVMLPVDAYELLASGTSDRCQALIKVVGCYSAETGIQ